MAETLTFENTTETTSIENLNADEQDSLKVGEAMVEAQDELLAGKYKDAQELEKAYVELQKKLGDKGSGDSSEARNSEDSEEVESEEGREEEEEAEVDTSKDGFLDTLWEEATGKDDYSKETLEELSKMDAADIADMHLRYRQQVEDSRPEITEQQVTELKNVAGGEQQYTEMLQWAKDSLNPQEIQMFDTVMERGDPLAAFFAVRSLAYRYQDSLGRDGQMITGTAPRGDGSQFNSQAEVVEAMSDPRYDRDPAFRQKIMKKLERSDINF
tara:strand:+ start:1202 stop:2014 length:813 start_codon:yes stop_codon:yes gene_type:complete